MMKARLGNQSALMSADGRHIRKTVTASTDLQLNMWLDIWFNVNMRADMRLDMRVHMWLDMRLAM